VIRDEGRRNNNGIKILHVSPPWGELVLGCESITRHTIEYVTHHETTLQKNTALIFRLGLYKVNEPTWRIQGNLGILGPFGMSIFL
jgi:hypothetical protein